MEIGKKIVFSREKGDEKATEIKRKSDAWPR